MNSEGSLRHAIQLLLSPLEEPFKRYLDVCDDVHARDASGNTLLHWAAALGNFSAAFALLQRGLAVDATNAHGATPLLLAAALSPNVMSVGYLLISHGALLAPPGGGDGGGNDDERITVHEVLKARQLDRVWEWFLECEACVGQHNNKSLASFDGRRQLPAAGGSAVTLLCSPAELQQLRTRGGQETSCAAVTVSVPRAPPRGQTAVQLEESVPFPTAAVEEPVRPSARSAERRSDSLALALAWQTQSQLMIAQETAHRVQIEKDELESFFYLYAETAAGTAGDYSDVDRDDITEDVESSRWSSLAPRALKEERRESSDASVTAATVGCIQVVLGERIDAEGRHHLLVRYDDSQATDGVTEAWHFADTVAADPVVRAYLERTYSAAVSADMSDAKMSSLMTMRNLGSPLDTWEREQLEAQLRLLPRRVLYSRDDGSPRHSRTSSPLHGSLQVVGTPLRGGNTPLVTDFVRKERQPGNQSGSGTNVSSAAAVVKADPRLSGGTTTAQDDHPSSSSVSAVFQERGSQRFSTRPCRLPGAVPVATTETSGEAKVGSQQLLLSGGGRNGRGTPAVPVEEECAQLRDTTPLPVSTKTSVYMSDGSIDTVASTSPALSTTPTKSLTTNSGSSADVLPNKASQRYLSASQKAAYNSYLYGAALRVLERQQQLQRRDLLSRNTAL
jgi:hypothetical protein